MTEQLALACTRLRAAQAALADAISAQGVSCTETDTFYAMAGKVSEISSGKVAVNLIPNSGLENGIQAYTGLFNSGWALAENVTDIVHSGTSAARAQCASGAGGFAAQYGFPCGSEWTEGHRYYFRAWIYRATAGAAYPDWMCSVAVNAAAQGSQNGINVASLLNVTNGIWAKSESVFTCSAATGLHVWTAIQCGLTTAGDATIVDDLLLVDLTDTFGAGKEPDTAACAALFDAYTGNVTRITLK